MASTALPFWVAGIIGTHTTQPMNFTDRETTKSEDYELMEVQYYPFQLTRILEFYVKSVNMMMS